MNKINRRLLSGASLAALALAVPSFARAATCVNVSGSPNPTSTGACVLTVGVRGTQLGAPGTAAVTDTGLISVDHVVAFANGPVTAEGVVITATNPGGHASAVFNNPGNTVAVTANNFGATTNATATAVGVLELAIGSSAKGLVVNSGLIAVSAHASATWLGKTHTANALAVGVAQIALAVSTASNSLINNGIIAVSANATAEGFAVPTAHANALAIGVVQAAFGSTAINFVSNNGLITAHANAAATASKIAVAVGTAAGVIQAASGTWAHNTVDNKLGGSILASANAFAGGDLPVAAAATASALARAAGVLQTALGFDSAHNVVNNSGIIAGTAHAKADSANNVAATASAAGVTQIAISPFGTAHNSVNNNGGVIAAFASASAWGATNAAFASAHAIGVNQHASGSWAFNTVNNGVGGLIAATAHAWASSASTAAVALAAATGVNQVAGASNVAADLVKNSGVIAAKATATAVNFTTPALGGFGTFAIAAAHAVGVNQTAVGSSAFATVSNNVGGAISAHANALAHSAIIASAHATATGIHQFASGTWAHDNVFNSGLINVGANATASFASGAFANAHAVGVLQSASATGGLLALANVTNAVGGVIAVSANASAHNAVKASAIATAIGVSQSADAWAGGVGALASAHVLNSGTIAVAAHATAFSASTAGAHALAIGVTQHAWGAFTNVDSVVNNGLIAVNANATAAGFLNAIAIASAGGVLQSASSGLFDHNVVVNNKTIAVSANAQALASVTSALAGAAALGVGQFAHDAFTNANSFTNNGALLVNANALAINGGGFAFASAVAQGVAQFATSDIVASNFVLNAAGALINVGASASATAFIAVAHAAAGGVLQSATALSAAGNVFHNSGTLNVHANAHASGFLAASAVANAFAVTQFASASGFAIDSVVNKGNITAHAHAYATFGTTDHANVSAQGIRQTASGGLFAQAFVQNVGKIHVTDTATAVAGPTFGAVATAGAVAGGISQFVQGGTTALATVINTGTIAPAAFANAYGFGFAAAGAFAIGINQNAAANAAPLSFAQAQVINNGIIDVTAVAVAKAVVSAIATAGAVGVFAGAFNADTAISTVINAGTISVQAKANAHGAIALASASAIGVTQVASAWAGGPAILAKANFTNSGLLNVAATASAHGGLDIPRAFAQGVNQSAFAISGATTNINHVLNATGGVINVSAHAVASVGNAAGFGIGSSEFAIAVGIHQSAAALFFPSLFLTNVVTNDGTIHVSASAVGVGGEWANVRASALGIGQAAAIGVFAVDDVFNNGHLTVNANVVAKTTQDIFGATAVAGAFGVTQFAWATTFGIDNAAVINGLDGVINVHAHALASAHSAGLALFSSASAHAVAVGVSQSMWGATAGLALATVINNGSLNVTASATAKGGFRDFAEATAVGVRVAAFTPAVLGLDIVNNGSFHVEAKAAGSGTGLAFATGVAVFGGNVVVGTIGNFGKMTVVASAAGAVTGLANAQGIDVFANQFNGLITNTGSLYVKAIGNAAEGVVASAIVVGSAGLPTGVGLGLIVNNSGTIYAGISNNGGTSFLRGTAINTVFAPNAMEILLEGSAHGTGHVYGNIFLSTDDAVVVANGKTCFNGVINSATLLNNGFLYASATGAVINPLFPVGILNGNLTIQGGGTLVLVNDPQQGGAAAYVANFSEQAGGDLVLEMRGIADGPGGSNQPGDGGPGLLPVVGKIVAGTSAFLHGALDLQPYAGLYTSTKVQIVSAGHINGQFTVVNSHSLFLSGTVSNNGNMTIDTLTITRNPFNSFGGTSNEHAVANGIENSYAALYAAALAGTLTPAQASYAQFVGSLFLIGPGAAGVAEFNSDLQQLSGVEYGEQAKAELTSTRILNDTIGTHLQVVAEGGNDSVGQLITGVSPAAGGTGIGKGNLWVSAYGDWGKMDSNSSGPNVDVTDRGVLVGADFDIDQMTKVGLVGAKISGVTDFRGDNGNRGDYNGWQLGIYGRYDSDPWYAEGVLSYATFTNDMVRNILIQPSQAGACCNFPFSSSAAELAAATTAGATKSHYDSHTFAAHGEVGYRVDTGSSIDLTPYLALSWMHGDSDAFHETGLPGVDLAVNDAAANSFTSFLGARFSTDWQLTDHVAISPIVRVAWEHEWDGNAWSVKESFFPAPLNSDIKVNGKGYSRDFASVGLGASVNVSSRVEAVLGYEGRWSSNEKDNALLGHINIHW